MWLEMVWESDTKNKLGVYPQLSAPVWDGGQWRPLAQQFLLVGRPWEGERMALPPINLPLFAFLFCLRRKLVLLPGFQKGRDIEASQGKGHGAVLAKKGQFVSSNEKI
jgi:hypothetical protein